MAKNTTSATINPITWDIFPKDRQKRKIPISLDAGECLFIVGANGSGKSALMLQLAIELRHKEEEIFYTLYSAHRQSWFNSEAQKVGKSNEDRINEKIALMTTDADYSNRWKDMWPSDGLKYENVFDDLIEKWTIFNNRLMSLSHQTTEKRIRETEKLKALNPLDKFNNLLKHGNIPITFSPDNPSATSKLIARHNDNGVNVDIRRLSDGERFIVFFAATVATLIPGEVLLIDEPDLHLHQSIINPFFSALVASRKDCFFVFSTHNISLVSAFPGSKVIGLRSNEWSADEPTRFDAKLIGPESPMPDYLKYDILGPKKKILYVEGAEGSWDCKLYRLLFPDFLVIGREGWATVEKSVKGLQQVADIYHIQARGIIDRDFRDDKKIKSFLKNNIGVLKMYSVESLYYSVVAVQAVASHLEKQKVFGREDLPFDTAISKGYGEVVKKSNAQKMILKRTKHVIREKALGQYPDDDDLIFLEETEFFIHIDNPYSEEKARFESVVDNTGWDDLLEYPLHQTTIFNTIAKSLKLKDTNDYKKMLISLVETDEKLAEGLRGYINIPDRFYDD
ncbi:MAG: AAA family ATPase [Oligoflexia bacterium]|nr:AAA family ATPase [Oligoflexia bacterium]